MDFDLSPEQQQIKALARGFADKEIAPGAREQYGGMGVDFVAHALITEEIGRVDSSVRTTLSVQISLVELTILKFGSEEQKRRYLPKLCRGEWLGCFGLTEPGYGSDAAGLATSAVRSGDDWILNGRKTWISNGSVSQLALVFARTDPKAPKAKGISAFILERDKQPYGAPEIHGKLGLRSSNTSELVFEDLRVPVAYAGQRKAFGKPIAAFQLVQELIADMVVETDAARLLVWRAGDVKNKGLPSTRETSIAKLYASEVASRCADRAIQVHGGYGFSDEFPVERYYRDARVNRLYEGTTQIQKLIVGRFATGIDAIA